MADQQDTADLHDQPRRGRDEKRHEASASDAGSARVRVNGVVVACLLGGCGLATGLILWVAQASMMVVIVAYLAIPAVMIVALYAITRRCGESTKVRNAVKPIATRRENPGSANHGTRL